VAGRTRSAAALSDPLGQRGVFDGLEAAIGLEQRNEPPPDGLRQLLL
jgi:hypothetical protein